MMFCNFDTGKSEQIVNIEALDDEAIVQYLPKYAGMRGDGPARELYRCYRLRGMGKLDAMIEILELVLGV